MPAKIGSGLQESQIGVDDGDGDGEFGIIYAQVSFLLLPVDIPCKHQHVSLAKKTIWHHQQIFIYVGHLRIANSYSFLTFQRG